jgi:formylmethanofuran dehydrogenase subunit D
MNQRNQLPTKSINKLPLNYYYKIYEQKKVHTKYGEAILVYLYDSETKQRFKVFLPKRYNNMISYDDSDSVAEQSYGEDDGNSEFPTSLEFYITSKWLL